MPSPGTANLGVFENHLRVVMVNFAAEKFFAAPHHSLATGELAIHRIARVIPKRKPHDAPFPIRPTKAAFVEFVVFPCCS